MIKNKLLIMFCMFLLIAPLVSAELLTFDNVKQYDEETKTLTIVDAFGLGSDIVEIKLNTPLNYLVPIGDDIKVAEMEFNIYEDYLDALKELKFYNVKDDMKEIQRQFNYKYKTIETILVDDYKEVCVKEVCHEEIIGKIEVEREVWKDFIGTDLIKDQVITIGIFTDVQKGDKVEWIPNYFGKEINEWASWTAGLNAGLIAGYKLDETSGTIVEDVLGVNNGMTNNMEDADWVAGKIGNALNFNGTDEYVNLTTLGTLGSSDEMTISFWIRNITNNNAGAIMGYAEGATEALQIKTETNGSRLIFARNTPVGGVLSGRVDYPNLTNGTWHNIIVNFDYSANLIDVKINALNQSVTYTNQATPVGAVFSKEFVLAAQGGDTPSEFSTIQLDEVYFWSRSLTDQEKFDLYNNGTGITYAATINILNSPVDTFNSTSNTINFNGTASAEVGLVNVSLIIDGAYNETNSSGINNTEYLFTKIIGDGSHNWTYEVCNSNAECLNTTARTFTISRYTENSTTFNSASYETASEVFYTNITTDGNTPTDGELIYDGTTYSATITNTAGNNYNISRTIDIPLEVESKSFNFNFTLSGTEFNTTQQSQSIGLTFFAHCNVTYPVPFLNISFKDESDDSFINASIPTSTFDYYLGSGDISKTLTYINTSLNFNYTFCATPANRIFNVDPLVQYKQGTAYPQRTFNASVKSYINTTTNSILYLLEAGDGLFVTFQTINVANQVVSGVSMNASRIISGVDTVVGQGVTGADGGLTLWLNPDFIHSYTFVKSGFPSVFTSFAPTQTSYTITLGSEAIASENYFKGIGFSVLPTDTSLVNDTIYTFGFNLTSSFWTLTNYGFDLRLVNGTKITGGLTTTAGTPLTFNYNVSNQSTIYLDYFWLIEGNFTNGTRVWVVYNTDNTQWSIATFFTDLSLYLDSGFFGIDDFGRYLFIFILIFFSVGIMSYKYGFTSPMTISLTTFLIVFFLDVVIKPSIIPAIRIASGNEIPYLLTFLTGLILVITLLRGATKV